MPPWSYRLLRKTLIARRMFKRRIQGMSSQSTRPRVSTRSLLAVLCVLLGVILLKVAFDPASTPRAQAKQEDLPLSQARPSVSPTPAILSSGANVSLANSYALALVSALAARDACSTLVPDATTLTALHNAAKLADGDDLWLSQKVETLKPQIQAAFLKQGAGRWCDSMWELFGPQGLGTLRRRSDQD